MNVDPSIVQPNVPATPPPISASVAPPSAEHTPSTDLFHHIFSLDTPASVEHALGQIHASHLAVFDDKIRVLKDSIDRTVSEMDRLDSSTDTNIETITANNNRMTALRVELDNLTLQQQEIEQTRARFTAEFDNAFQWLKDHPNIHHTLSRSIGFATAGELRHIQEIKRRAERSLAWLEQFNLQSASLRTLHSLSTTIVDTTQNVHEEIENDEFQADIRSLLQIPIHDLSQEDFAQILVSHKAVVDRLPTELIGSPLFTSLIGLRSTLDRIRTKALAYLAIDATVVDRLPATPSTAADLEKLALFTKKLAIQEHLRGYGVSTMTPEEMASLKSKIEDRTLAYMNTKFAQDMAFLTTLNGQTTFSGEDMASYFEIRAKLNHLKEILKDHQASLDRVTQAMDLAKTIQPKIQAQSTARSRTMGNVTQVAAAANVARAAFASRAQSGVVPMQAQGTSLNPVIVQRGDGLVLKGFDSLRSEEEERTFNRLSSFRSPTDVVQSATIRLADVRRYGMSTFDQATRSRSYSIDTVDDATLLSIVSKLKTLDTALLSRLDGTKIDREEWFYQNPGETTWTSITGNQLRSLYHRGIINENTRLDTDPNDLGHHSSKTLKTWRSTPWFDVGIHQMLRDNARWEYKKPGENTWTQVSFVQLRALHIDGKLPNDASIRPYGGRDNTPLSTYLNNTQFFKAIHQPFTHLDTPEMHFVPDLSDPATKAAYETCERYQWEVTVPGGGSERLNFRDLHHLILDGTLNITEARAVAPDGSTLPANIEAQRDLALGVGWKLVTPQIFKTPTARTAAKNALNDFTTRTWSYTLNGTTQTVSFAQLKTSILNDPQFLQGIQNLEPQGTPPLDLDHYVGSLNLVYGTPWETLMHDVIIETTIGSSLEYLSDVEAKPFVRDMSLLHDVMKSHALLEAIKTRFTPDTQLIAIAIGLNQPLDMHANNIGLAPVPNAAYDHYSNALFTVGSKTYTFQELHKLYLENPTAINDTTVLTMTQGSTQTTPTALNQIPDLREALNVQWKLVFFDTDLSLGERNGLQYQTGTARERDQHGNVVDRSLTGHLVPFRSALLQMNWRNDSLNNTTIAQLLNTEGDEQERAWARYDDAPIMQRLTNASRTRVREIVAGDVERSTLDAIRRSGAGNTLAERRESFGNNMSHLATPENRATWEGLQNELLWSSKGVNITNQNNTVQQLHTLYGQNLNPDMFEGALRKLNPGIDLDTLQPNTRLLIPQANQLNFPEMVITNQNNTIEKLFTQYGRGCDRDLFMMVVKILNPQLSGHDDDQTFPASIEKIRLPLDSNCNEATAQRKKIAEQLFPRITAAQLQAREDRKTNSRKYLTNYQNLERASAPTQADLLAYLDDPTTPLDFSEKERIKNLVKKANTAAELNAWKDSILNATRPSYFNVMASMYPYLADTYALYTHVYGTQAGARIGHFDYPIQDAIRLGQASTDKDVRDLANHLQGRIVAESNVSFLGNRGVIDRT